MTAVRETITELATSAGTARIHLAAAGKPLAALGHGAGGGVEAADLRAVTAALLDLDLSAWLDRDRDLDALSPGRSLRRGARRRSGQRASSSSSFS